MHRILNRTARGPCVNPPVAVLWVDRRLSACPTHAARPPGADSLQAGLEARKPPASVIPPAPLGVGVVELPLRQRTRLSRTSFRNRMSVRKRGQCAIVET